eukprot:COSAG01_NODE_768_length_13739_cov_6.271334_11_plen_94_part_00
MHFMRGSSYHGFAQVLILGTTGLLYCLGSDGRRHEPMLERILVCHSRLASLSTFVRTDEVHALRRRPFGYFMARTESVAEIPRQFYAFHARFF